MNAADVLVLPYQDILNSGSVYLGLSFGIPIIAPEIGCIPSTMPQTTKLLYDLDGENLKDKLRTSRNIDLHDERSHNLSRGKELTWRKSAEHFSNIYMRLGSES
jgi:glycosyltransferase involved in cell wall biosynthesis